MIKWTGGGENNRKVVGLGITRANVERLRTGEPMYINGDELGIIGVDIVIHYGATEAIIIAEMRKLGVDTPLQRRDVGN